MAASSRLLVAPEAAFSCTNLGFFESTFLVFSPALIAMCIWFSNLISAWHRGHFPACDQQCRHSGSPQQAALSAGSKQSRHSKVDGPLKGSEGIHPPNFLSCGRMAITTPPTVEEEAKKNRRTIRFKSVIDLYRIQCAKDSLFFFFQIQNSEPGS